MTIEQMLKAYILEKYETMSDFADSIEMPNTTLSSIMNRGIYKSNAQNIIKICKALDISADSLAQGQIVPNKTKRKQIDLSEKISVLKLNIHQMDLTLDGATLTDDEKDYLLDSIELAVEFIRRRKK